MCHKIRCDEKSWKLFDFQDELNKATVETFSGEHEPFFLKKN